MTTVYTEFHKWPKPASREQLIELFLSQRLDAIDAATGGYVEVSLQDVSGNHLLDPDEASHGAIILTDTPGGVVTVQIPEENGANALIAFRNTTGSTVTIKSEGANTGNSSGVSVANSANVLVMHDGESAYQIGSSSANLSASRLYGRGSSGAGAAQELTPGTGLLISGTTLSVVRPGVKARLSIDQSIASGGEVPLTWDTEEWDDDGFHSTSSNTNRFVIPSTGTYEMSGLLRYAVSTAGAGRGYAIRNQAGVLIPPSIVIPPTAGGYNTDVIIAYSEAQMSAGDWLEVRGFHDVGVAHPVKADASCFVLRKVI